MQGAGHRVAITGYGVVAPCGVGKAAFWQGLLGPGITNAKTVELADWDPQPYFSNPKEARRADRVEQFALAAALEAITQSGVLPYEPSRMGSIFGTGIGGPEATGMRQRLFHQALKLGTAVGKALQGLVRGACHTGRERGLGSLLHLAAMILAEATHLAVAGDYPQPSHVP